MSTSLILATVVVADLALNAALLFGRLRNRAGERRGRLRAVRDERETRRSTATAA
jgi:hypothetical protein